MKNDKDMEKLNQMDMDGVNFRHQKQKEKLKSFLMKKQKEEGSKAAFQEGTGLSGK